MSVITELTEAVERLISFAKGESAQTGVPDAEVQAVTDKVKQATTELEQAPPAPAPAPSPAETTAATGEEHTPA